MKSTTPPEIQSIITRLEEDAADLFNRGKYVGAIRKLNQAIKILPSYGKLYFIRGSYKFLQKQWGEAAKDFTQAISKKHDVEAYFYRGCCYLHQGNVSKAESDFSKAIESGVTVSGVVYYYRAFTRSLQHFSASAIAADLNNAISRLNPKSDSSLIEKCKAMLNSLKVGESKDSSFVDQNALPALRNFVRTDPLPNYFLFTLRNRIEVELEYKDWILSDNHLVSVSSASVSFYPLDSLSNPFIIQMHLSNTSWAGDLSFMAWHIKAWVSPRDKFVVLSLRNFFEVWNLSSKKLIHTVQIEGDSDSSIQGVTWHPGGNCFALITEEEILLVRVDEWAKVARVPLIKPILSLYQASFSWDGSQIFCISADSSTVQIYSLDNLKAPRSVPIKVRWNLGFSAIKDKTILINVGLNQIQCFDLEQGNSLFGWNVSTGVCTAISPTCPVVALVENGELFLLDVRQKGLIKHFAGLSSNWHSKQRLCFSSNGMYLVEYSNSQLRVYG